MANFTEILNTTRNKLLENTEIESFEKGSIAREIMELYAREAERSFNFLENKFTQGLLSSATGEFLDQLGLLVGIARNTNQRAYGEVTFSIDPVFGKDIVELEAITGEPIQFPTGTYVQNRDGSIVYTTTEPFILTNSPTIIPVLAEGSGSGFNVGVGELSRFVFPENTSYDNIKDFILVTNNAGITTGSDNENDQNYRFRITRAFQDHAKANEAAVRIAALSVPGVSDVFIRNYDSGIGTFSVYVVSESPIVSDGVLAAVQEAVNQVAAAGIRGIAAVPSYEAIHLEIVLHFESATSEGDKDLAVNNANSAVVDYINNLLLGQDLIVNQIVNVILNISNDIKNVEITIFGRGDYNATTGKIDNYEPLIIKDQEIEVDAKWVTNKNLCRICCIN